MSLAKKTYTRTFVLTLLLLYSTEQAEGDYSNCTLQCNTLSDLIPSYGEPPVMEWSCEKPFRKWSRPALHLLDKLYPGMNRTSWGCAAAQFDAHTLRTSPGCQFWSRRAINMVLFEKSSSETKCKLASNTVTGNSGQYDQQEHKNSLFSNSAGKEVPGMQDILSVIEKRVERIENLNSDVSPGIWLLWFFLLSRRLSQYLLRKQWAISTRIGRGNHFITESNDIVCEYTGSLDLEFAHRLIFCASWVMFASTYVEFLFWRRRRLVYSAMLRFENENNVAEDSYDLLHSETKIILKLLTWAKPIPRYYSQSTIVLTLIMRISIQRYYSLVCLRSVLLLFLAVFSFRRLFLLLSGTYHFEKSHLSFILGISYLFCFWCFPLAKRNIWQINVP